jgi:hypothetical protein
MFTADRQCRCHHKATRLYSASPKSHTYCSIQTSQRARKTVIVDISIAKRILTMADKGKSTAVAVSATKHVIKTGRLKMSDAQLQYIDKLLTILIGFTTFGASITFGLIVSENKVPPDPSNLAIIDKLMAISWVLFVVGMLLASLATTILYAYEHVSSKKHTDHHFINLRDFIDYCGWKGSYTILTGYLLLLLLPLAGALLCLAVVVTLYIPVVGIAALVGFGGGFLGILLFSLWYLALGAEEWIEGIEQKDGGGSVDTLGADISKTLQEYVKASVQQKMQEMKLGPDLGTV